MNTSIKEQLEAYVASMELDTEISVSANSPKVFKLEDILNNQEFAELKKQIQKDTRKGLAFRLSIGEEITFPDLKDMKSIVDGFEIYNGQVRCRISVAAYSSIQGCIPFPFSIMRRIFAMENVEIEGKDVDPIEWFYKDHPMSKFAQNTMDDLQRASEVAGKTIVVKDKQRLKFHVIEGIPPKRTGDFKFQDVYKFEEKK